MHLYLIVRCDELDDPWECDADRTPITLTGNWDEWFNQTEPDYDFEVYEFTNNDFTRIKEYDSHIEDGMVFAFYDDEEEKAIPIQKFPNLTRDSKVPAAIMERARKGEDYDNQLESFGSITWHEGDTSYAYTEYYDNQINMYY